MQKGRPLSKTSTNSNLSSGIDDREAVRTLLTRIKKNHAVLQALLSGTKHHWPYEDGVYRYYHQSYKVYGLQTLTLSIVKALRSLRPGEPLNERFVEIVADGTGRVFKMQHNRDWANQTRPIVEAYFHARYFLEMAIRYGTALKVAPSLLPSGWAAVLYLYNLR